MKYYLLTILSIIMLTSCNNEAQEKKTNLVLINKSFKQYIFDNDLKKDFITKLDHVRALSYIQLDTTNHSNPNELYEAKVWMKGTTALMNSSKVYNVNDTVTCYFDKDFKMLRLVNPNNNQ